MLEFYKYHGLGNDFIIVEEPAQPLSTEQVSRLCRRNFGVGADGVLQVKRLGDEPVPTIQMVIFNRDGTRPRMCGNGVRCVAAFAQRRWGFGGEVIIESDAGPRRCIISADDTGDQHLWDISVDMGEAFSNTSKAALAVGGREFVYVAVDVGNPHAVIFEDVDVAVVEEVGRFANDNHRLFDGGINVEFAAPRDDGTTYDVLVYEHGVGLTRACGTGACAVAWAAWETGRTPKDESITIVFPGGPLEISARDGRIWMKGSAEEVFSGTWPVR